MGKSLQMKVPFLKWLFLLLIFFVDIGLFIICSYTIAKIGFFQTDKTGLSSIISLFFLFGFPLVFGLIVNIFLKCKW